MHEREIDEVIRTKQPVRGKIPCYGKGGGGIFDYIFAPVFGPDGNVEAVAGTTRDVTELDRTLQALREVDKRKDEFLATLAHELRNPLAPLRNSIELLEDTSNGAELHSARAIMGRQVQHMVHLVDDLLDLSRVSCGVIEVRRGDQHLQDILEIAVETPRPLMEKQQHELVVDLPAEDLPVHGDDTRLSQIFGNLLNNAAKYTDAGGRIHLLAERVDDSVRVSVSDNGIGIGPEDQHRVFDMFAQVRPGNGNVRGGLGIGLHIVKRLVEMHGGTIDVRSDGPGRGSSFQVSLPLCRASLQYVASSAPTVSVKRRVLIVDDDVDAAFTLSIMLKKKGHDVHATYGAHEAINLAESFRPEFIFLDRQAGARGMDYLKNSRIIALTGWGQEEDRRKTREAGFDEHLVKPVGLAEIEEVLTQYASA